MSSRDSQGEDDAQSPSESGGNGKLGTDSVGIATVSKQKRIACIICRRRKLRCDGNRPSCATCSRLNHKCAYDEVRRKSGPKRGYVKDLEARLSQLESQLRARDNALQSRQNHAISQGPLRLRSHELSGDMGQDMMAGFANVTVDPHLTSTQPVPNVTITASSGDSSSANFPWELTSLGLEEALPPNDFIEDMYSIYFEKIAPSFPMIHKYRFLAAMNLAHRMRPAICLRYSIWALACSVTEKYSSYADIFYQKARKYAEADEMKGHGESFMTVGHAQCWILITSYEFKMLFFPRAWMSAGRASRLALMLGLHRQDGNGLEVKRVISPPKDWTDIEERRRTFWAAYCNDRYASIGTGWPMTFDECDIMTNLPASPHAFEKSIEEETSSLVEGMSPEGAKKLSSFAGVVLMACLFGKNLLHLHRSTDSDRPDDPSGEFWKRHNKLDSYVMTLSMNLPDHLKVPRGIKDANVVFLNMTLLAATICLHQAAILKAENHNLSSKLIRESTDRCYNASEQISALTRLVPQADLATMNPFISFCLYVAARIYTHAYKRRPNDETIRSSLDFLMITMQSHRKKNPITESFLVQIMVELDAAGLDHALYRQDPTIMRSTEGLVRESDKCSPVFQSLSKTQPSFHELHSRDSTSPKASNLSYAASHSSGSRAHSPQIQYQSSFVVPNRESSSSLQLSSRPQQYASQNISTPRSVSNAVPGQAWVDSTDTDSRQIHISTSYIRHGSARSLFASPTLGYDSLPPSTEHVKRASSHPTYSPQPQLHESDPLESAASSGNPYYSTATAPPGNTAEHYTFAHTPGGTFPSSQAPPHGSFGIAPDADWDMAQPLHEGEWGAVMESMNWGEDAGGGMHGDGGPVVHGEFHAGLQSNFQGMNWRSIPGTVGEDQ